MVILKGARYIGMNQLLSHHGEVIKPITKGMIALLILSQIQ